MKPEIVSNPTKAPAKCIVTKSWEGEFIDTKTYAGWTDPYIYLHVPYVKELARDLLGMVDAEEVESLREKVKELEGRVEEYGKLAGLVGELQAAENAIEESVA